MSLHRLGLLNLPSDIFEGETPSQTAATIIQMNPAVAQELSAPQSSQPSSSSISTYLPLIIGAGAIGAVVLLTRKGKRKKISGIPVIPIVVIGGLGIGTYMFLKKTGVLGATGGTQSADTFSVDQIVGKTLIANRNTSVYDAPYDSANVIATITAGNPVGVVYSYLEPDPADGRTQLFWMFQDASGGYYYVPHAVGQFNISSLVQQGVLTDQQIAQSQEPEWQQLLQQYLPWIIGGAVIIALGSAAIKKVL
jgi:hypothetical protein